MNKKSTDERMTEVATDAVKEYVKTNEFREKIEVKYYAEMKGLVERAERKATILAGLAALLMFGIFTVACTLQFLNIREKRTEIYEQYVDALSLVNTLNQTITKTKTDVDDRLQAVERKVGNFEIDTRDIEHGIRQLEKDLQAANKGLENLSTQDEK